MAFRRSLSSLVNGDLFRRFFGGIWVCSRPITPSRRSARVLTRLILDHHLVRFCEARCNLLADYQSPVIRKYRRFIIRWGCYVRLPSQSLATSVRHRCGAVRHFLDKSSGGISEFIYADFCSSLAPARLFNGGDKNSQIGSGLPVIYWTLLSPIKSFDRIKRPRTTLHVQHAASGIQGLADSAKAGTFGNKFKSISIFKYAHTVTPPFFCRFE